MVYPSKIRKIKTHRRFRDYKASGTPIKNNFLNKIDAIRGNILGTEGTYETIKNEHRKIHLDDT
jgi:hypothetical protein